MPEVVFAAKGHVVHLNAVQHDQHMVGLGASHAGLRQTAAIAGPADGYAGQAEQGVARVVRVARVDVGSRQDRWLLRACAQAAGVDDEGFQFGRLRGP